MKMPGRVLCMMVAVAGAFVAATPAQAAARSGIDHMEPPFWWAGMRDTNLQLMVHGRHIAQTTPSLNYPGVRIDSVTRVANTNYLFINLTVSGAARPGKFDILFGNGADAIRYTYELRERALGSAERRGFDSSDAIYQVMPDRFANGNPANDSVAGMPDKLNRKDGSGRHGGDIDGIVSRLDYIAGMGFTQLWPTPLVENNMPAHSYHGYAATDHYKIDARYGSNEDYRRLVSEAKKRGIGTIQDVVLSHIGSSHWWMKDLPSPDWTNYGTTFKPNRHHRVAVQDPYAAQEDRDNFTRGWFAPTMPDLNQSNPLVANYLIQNNIWWIEYAGLSGLRIDTYGYSDTAFLADYTRRIMAEYPNLNMVGEEWSKRVPVVAHWQRGKPKFNGYVSSLPSLMDFPLMYALREALVSNEDTAFDSVYETLSLDYLYQEPSKLVLFEGNHDIARMYSVVGEDFDLYKMVVAFTLTAPRVPQFYYGTEILMTSTVEGRNDASYREDFPGGWAGDKVDAVKGTGLSARQREAQDFVRKLATWRKTQPVIHHGKTMHYGAEDGTYVLFRYEGGNKVMVAFNKNAKPAVLDLARFHEMLGGVKSGRDVISGQTVTLGQALTMPAKGTLILEIVPE
jgi:glycosidase